MNDSATSPQCGTSFIHFFNILLVRVAWTSIKLRPMSFTHKMSHWALSIVLLATSAQANTIVDLRSEMGKIRNQSNKGWCYANAAADLLSHKFLEPAKNISASAIFMALSYIHQYEDGDGIMDGGYDYRALLAAKEIGLCPSEFDQKILWSGFNIGNLKEKLAFIGELYALKKKIIQHEKKRDASFQALRELHQQYDAAIRRLKGSNSILAPLITRYSDEEISKFVAETDEDNFYFELAKIVCRGKQITIPNDYVVRNTRFIGSPKTTTVIAMPIMPLLPVRYVNPDKKRFFVSRKHQTHTSATQFDDLNKTHAGWAVPTEVIESYLKKRIPVSISYYSKFLSKNFLEKGFAVKQADELRTGSHASVIVAERTVGRSQSKEFLIRNSWGEGCGSYDLKLRATHCEKGHIWVPEDVLNVFLNEVTAIE